MKLALLTCIEISKLLSLFSNDHNDLKNGLQSPNW